MKFDPRGFCRKNSFSLFDTSTINRSKAPLLIAEVELVGGSGPNEGNILVWGQPVCDDDHPSYGAQNALVVCRFISNDVLNRGNAITTISRQTLEVLSV